MGGFTSKAFTDLIQEPETPPHTPVRVAAFDPRSPSVGITRTPIQVEKTPDTVIDPRSPSVGIARTPILEDKFTVKATGLDTLVPAPLSLDDSVGDRTEDSLIVDTPLPPLDVTEDSELSETPPATRPVTTSCMQSPLSTIDTNTNTPTENAISGSTEKLGAVKSKKQHHRTKQLQQSSSPHKRNSKTGHRSPLTPMRVDTNSPRVIVQRKQVAKLGLMQRHSNSGTPVKYERMQDKENAILQY